MIRADRELLRHFLAAIAYRTQKAVRDAPPEYWTFEPGNRTRTPLRILRHMTSLMGYTRTLFLGGTYAREPEPLADIEAELARFHGLLRDVGSLLDANDPPLTIAEERLLQGPLADAMTHVGQLALLRRLVGSPVPPESFVHADIAADRLGADQPMPAAPDEVWPEAPPTDVPLERPDC